MQLSLGNHGCFDRKALMTKSNASTLTKIDLVKLGWMSIEDMNHCEAIE